MSHHWPGLISRSHGYAGALIHSRKRGWFNGTPSPPSGGAWSSTLSVICRKAQPLPKTRRETCDHSFVNGPSRARRHRGTRSRSLFPVDSVKDHFVPIVGAHKMSLKRKSSVGAGFSHLVELFIGVTGADSLIESDLVLPVYIIPMPENLLAPQYNPGSPPL